MIAVDTNILVHAHRRDADLHERAEAEIRQLAESEGSWGICYHNWVEFYGIVTHSKLWKQPSTPTEAMDQIQAWRESPSLHTLMDTERTLEILSDLVRNSVIRGPLVHDARIASVCMANGVAELWTVDRDYSRFPQLKTRNPLIE